MTSIFADFTDLQWDDDAATLTFNAQVGELKESIWVRLPGGTRKPSDDLIAIFLATLAGPELAGLRMELRVSESVAQTIEQYCGSNLDALRSADASNESLTAPKNHALSFSGGFDSLAALSLLPGDPYLISMDFGGWFERETEFFSTFHPTPHIVSTNFRMAGFGRRSWMFMLAGVILLRDALNLGSFTTGSILESSPWNYKRYVDHMPAAPGLLSDNGFEQVNTTLGITEVGTTLLTMRHFPDHVGRSLASLAAPGSGKSLRKQMLVRSLWKAGKAELPFDPEVTATKTPPLKYGQSLTDDMLMPYMVKRLGGEMADALMAGYPPEFLTLAKSRSLNFYERFHPGFYTNLEPSLMKHLFETLIEAGIVPFTERDWEEYREIIAILKDTHALPATA